MKTKVLMVYPEIPETFWSFKHSLKFIGKKATFPPLSLLTVAALLPDRYDVKLIDMNVRPLAHKDIVGADIVFTSSMLVQKESLERVIRACRELGKPVVAGGPYPTSGYGSIDGVDHFVLNEAEVTLPPFIEDLEAGRAKRIYSSDRRPDISLTPKPRYDLIDPRPYASMVLQYSRGCPFNCEFCEIIELFGRKPRVKTPDQFLGEIDSLYRTGYRGQVFIVDDNFIGNKASAKEVLRRLVAWQAENGYPFRFFTEASIDLAKDEELLDLMAGAGFTMTFVGIETPVEESLELAHKRQNLGLSLTESVHRIQEKGIEVTGGFIVGFDSDPEDIADRQIGFIRESGITTAMVGLLTALPNTQLYRRLQSENRILSESTGNNTHSLEVNFVPKMDKARLIESYVKVLTTIYDPKEYFDRCLTLLRLLPRQSMVNPSFADAGSALTNLRALFLSLVKQTFSPYGLHYLRFIASALRRAPRLFPKAVELAVYGHNFFKLTRVKVKDKYAVALKLARFFDQAVEWVETLGRTPAPERFEKALAETCDLRAKLADIVRVVGSTPLLTEINLSLLALTSGIRGFVADRSGRFAELVRTASEGQLRSFSRAVDRYRKRFVTTALARDMAVAAKPLKSGYSSLISSRNAVDSMVVDVGAIIRAKHARVKTPA